MLGDHLVFPILLARDLVRSRAFYEGSLGLEVIREDADRFVLRSRGVRIEAYTAPDPVTDADGVADMGHSWAAWIIDPDGNALAIVQPKPAPKP